MDTKTAHLAGYAVGTSVALRHGQAQHIKTASADPTMRANTVSYLVTGYENRLAKRAARVAALGQAIAGT